MNTATHPGEFENQRSLAERLRVPLMVAGVAVVVLAASVAYLTGGRYESTDDAYVLAARVSVSSSVPGRVVEIAVHDNQIVHRGDLLFQLDQRPYRIAVAETEAKLATARLQVVAGKAAYREKQAAIRSAEFTLAYEKKEYERQNGLLASGVASQARVSSARHALDTARQQLSSTQQQADSVLAMLGGQADLDPDDHPAVAQARAALDHARLNLSYTEIRAPTDGIVTKVEQLQVGDYINAATPVFALISTQDVWVEANFKEDQLTHMRPGDSATIDVDRYPDHRFKARVNSIAPGTGAQFSALPPENATGNWVKVVQRVPVRLQLLDPDPKLLLSAGLSANVEVDTGHRRHLFSSPSSP